MKSDKIICLKSVSYGVKPNYPVDIFDVVIELFMPKVASISRFLVSWTATIKHFDSTTLVSQTFKKKRMCFKRITI